MDPLTLFLYLVVAVAVLAAWRVVRYGQSDALRAAGWVEAGLLLGSLAQLLHPAGFVVGGIVGLLVGFGRLNAIGRGRMAAVERELAIAETSADRLLALHDARDSVGSETSFLRQLGSAWQGLFLLVVAVVAVAIGFREGAPVAMVLGSLLAFGPLAGAFGHVADREEAQMLRERFGDSPDVKGQLDAHQIHSLE